LPNRPSRNANRLFKYFADGEIKTSSELIRALKADGLSEENARQTIRRQAKTNAIWRSAKLKLGGNERLFAASASVGSVQFFNAVSRKLSETKRFGLARCLSALGRFQILHKVEAVRLLAVSPNRGATARLYETELAALREVGVKLIHGGTLLESLISPNLANGSDSDELAMAEVSRLRTEALLARVLGERLRRENMVSWNRIEFPDPGAPYTIFNDQVFTTYGFSYLSPLTRWNPGGRGKPKPCPVLIDCYGRLCTSFDIQSFAQRVERAVRRGRSSLKSLGIVAASAFEPDAWGEARRRGFATVNLRQAFGEQALEAMALVEKLLSDLERGTDSNSEACLTEFSRLLHELKANPVVISIRSLALEALCCLILSVEGYEQVNFGRVVPWENTKRDVDAFGIRADELRVIECKAYGGKKSVTPGEIRKFFTQTVPALKGWLLKTNRPFRECNAEIWTTGTFGTSARQELQSLKPPHGDSWTVKTTDELKETLPVSLKERSVELLESIGMSAGSDEDVLEFS
jgi:hypothetical protein